MDDMPTERPQSPGPAGTISTVGALDGQVSRLLSFQSAVIRPGINSRFKVTFGEELWTAKYPYVSHISRKARMPQIKQTNGIEFSTLEST
jgi:hypothetical protein